MILLYTKKKTNPFPFIESTRFESEKDLSFLVKTPSFKRPEKSAQV